MPNRLIDTSSPYLLGHAHNPVEWYPWGAEALERARREGKPIFLSIGYAACHWCHVMEHESFENPVIAAVMNEHFINIKVDREERPDLDDLYMLATQLMTGQGGWPMSVWLTPELEPFYAGTYFPPADGFGRPGFLRLLEALHDAWVNRRGDLEAQAKKVVEAIRLNADESAGNAAVTATGGEAEEPRTKIEMRKLVRLAIEQSSDRFDQVHGGLGSAPKFPPHQMLQLWVALLNSGAPEVVGLSEGDRGIVAQQLNLTLRSMADGGIYDQVGGGFARYSTDERWLVPHFEKMLYDNAQLAPVYAAAALLFDNPDYARMARETLDFFLREMQSPEGAFYCSLDADSEGAEGKYYVWTLEDIYAAIPDLADDALIIAHYNLTAEGNWHESPTRGGNVLAVARDAASLAEQASCSPGDMRTRLNQLRERMRDCRAARPRPNLDDNILTSWNGLMLSALAIAGRLLGERRYVAAAERLAWFLLTRHVTAEGLQRVSRHGAAAHTPAFLDDYAFLLNGVVDLLEAQPENAGELRNAAWRFADVLLHEFQDPRHGGFYFTGPRHEKFFARMKNAADNATPSPNGVAIRALFRLGALMGKGAYTAAAERAVQAFEKPLARRPEYFPTILLALLERGDAPLATGSAPVGDRVTAPEIPAAANAGAALTLAAEPLPPLHAGVTFDVALELTIPSGFHIQPHDAAAPNIPTLARLRALGENILARHAFHYPAPESIHETIGYANTIMLHAQGELSATAAPGNYVLRATLFAQRCTAHACLAPEQLSVDIPLTIEA